MATGNMHIFSSEEDFLQHLKEYEIQTHTRFVRQWTSKPDCFNELKSLEKFKVRFEDVGHPSQSELKLEGDGVPFIIVGNDIFECHQGPIHKGKRNGKKEPDHSYSGRKKSKIQTTKKQNCPAKIRVRKIIKFPGYQVVGNSTCWGKKKASKRLKDEFNENTEKNFLLYALFPTENDHKDHLMGEHSSYTQPIDKAVISKIKELAIAGHRNVGSVKIMLEAFSKELAPEVSSTNRRFYPSNSDIRSHMYHALLGSNLVSADDDQAELHKLVHQWQEKNPDDRYFFRPASYTDKEVNSLLLVMQTDFQRRLLGKYGHYMTLMDATYKTTNIDSKAAVMEGLAKIKEWNQKWTPMAFICDYDLREIGALESTFKGSQVYLCDFHREQSWKKWIGKNDVGNKEELLEKLRHLACAQTESEFGLLVENLKESPLFKENDKFRNWFEKKWLNESKRWAFCFRKDQFNLTSSTNGIERQHRFLKEQYIKEFGIGKSISNVCSILVEKYFPECEIRYKRENSKSRGDCRQYSTDVPTFLKDRPTPFVKHCLQRLPPAVTELSRDDIVQSPDGTFLVNSKDSQNTYNVETIGSMPKCSCPDFKKCNWPCKHVLAVNQLYESPGSMENYFKSPLFVLDDYFDNDNDLEAIRTVVQEDYEEHEVSEHKERKCCLEILGQLESEIYSLANTPVLTLTKDKLNQVLQFTRQFNTTRSVLSVTKRKKWRRTANRRVHKRINIQRKSKKEYISDNSTLDSEDLEKYSDSLTSIWNAPGNDSPVLQVGPYVITTNSFHYIKSTLSDDVIDASLQILLKAHNVMHINCITTTAIFNGNKAVHHNLPGENFNNYEACVGAISECSNTHWSLIIVQPAEKLITYLNPLGETSTTFRKLLCNWNKFLNDRYEMGIEPAKPAFWKIRSLPHSKQQDGLSCGVYTIKFAENFFNRKPLTFDWSPEDVLKERKRIALRILAASTVNPVIHSSSRNSPRITTAKKRRLSRSSSEDLKEITQTIDVESDAEYESAAVSTHTKTSKPNESPVNETHPKDTKLNAEVSNMKCKTKEVIESEKTETNSKSKVVIKDRDKGSEFDDTIQSNNMEDSSLAKFPVKQPTTSMNYEETNTKCPFPGYDSKGEKRKRQTTPRNKPKKKRSSFIYCESKKRSRQCYCVCNKPDDGRLYWQCEKCGNWWHPDCIGLSAHHEPTHFLCDACKDKTGNSSYRISVDDIRKTVQWSEIENHLKEIVQCVDESCTEPDHARHHAFIRDPFGFAVQERKAVGFGEEVYDSSAVDWFQESITAIMTYNLHPKFPATSPRVSTVQGLNHNTRLYRIFVHYGMAFNYMYGVLLKEAMLHCLCLRNTPYEEADRRCRLSEIDRTTKRK